MNQDQAQELEPKTARKIFVWQMTVFAALFSLVVVDNIFTTVADRARVGQPLPVWQPSVWEISSNSINWLLVPLVARVLARFPINSRTWARSVPVHAVAVVLFSLIHTEGMNLLRQAAYRLADERYDFGPFWSSWVYELRKDLLTYCVIIGGLLAFRTYGLWLDSRTRRDDVAAANVLGLHPAGPDLAVPNVGANVSGLPAPGPLAIDPPTPLDRLLVRKRNREFILDTDEIDRIEADGNYVVVHSGSESYRLRESLDGLAKRLGEQRFARVHRAHVVNIDRIREIQPWDHGDFRIVLKDGSFVNFSRRYRSRLQHLFQ